MDEAEIIVALQGAFRRAFLDPTIVIDRTTSAADVDGWDSLSHVMLLLQVEKQFAIKMPRHEANRLNDVGDLIDLIAGKLRHVENVKQA